MNSFEQLGLPAPLSAALAQMKYETPTPIQAKAIPLALTGRDILGSAQTGTGKTAAFAIPLIARLINNPRGTALILTPTRELATQIMDIITQLLSQHRSIKSALIIGGESMPNQIRLLKATPRIIIGTPGRINDHLERGTLRLHDANFLVLDETDRMLDMGFGVQLDAMFRYLPKVRQTLMFSATLPAAIVKLSEKYLNNPERVAVGEQSQPAQKLTQDVQYVAKEQKYARLLEELDARDGSILIFVKTKRNSDQMAEKLQRKGYAAEAIHGDLRQNRRNKVIQMFRDQKYRILVATDVVARGLDIPHIEHVINYDLPMAAEDYIHRIGRTARAGATGSALCLISPDDQKKWRAIERLLDPTNSKDDHLYEGTGAGKGKSTGKRRSFGGGRSFGDNKRSRSFDGKRQEENRKPARDGDQAERAERPIRSERPVRDGVKRDFQKRDERPNRDESRGERRPARDGERFNRDGDKREFRKRDDRPRSDRPARDGERTDTPRSDDRGFRSDRPTRDEGRRERRPMRDGDRSHASRDGEKREFRKRDDRARDDRPRSDRPARDGERTYASRSEDRSARSDRPRSDHTKSDRPSRDEDRRERRPTRDGERAYVSRDGAARTGGDKPFRSKRDGAKRDGARRDDAKRDGGQRSERKPSRDGERSERRDARSEGDKSFRPRKGFSGNKPFKRFAA